MSNVSKIFRFCLVGGASSVTYLILVNLLIIIFPKNEVLSSFLAYSLCIGISYMGQRNITFKSSNNLKPEIVRFTFVSISGLMLSSLLVYILTTQFSVTPHFSFLAVFVTIPILNYFLYNHYVFKSEC